MGIALQCRPAAAAPPKDADGPADIVDLINRRAITAEVSGVSITTVAVTLRRRVKTTVEVRIPAGTWFASGKADVQNMLAVEEATQTLDSDEPVVAHVAVACANRPRGVPGEKDKLRIARAAPSTELQKLAKKIKEESPPRAVVQAAVWIVSDNASFDEMHATLVVRTRNALGMDFNRPVIGEEEAARAMKLCRAAGIFLSNKRIWKDRGRIAPGEF